MYKYTVSWYNLMSVWIISEWLIFLVSCHHGHFAIKARKRGAQMLASSTQTEFFAQDRPLLASFCPK